jgi:hypothetical protein
VTALHFYENATITRGSGGAHYAPAATRGIAPSMGLQAQPQAPTGKPNERNTTTALIELGTPQGPLGTWLVSNVFEHNLPPQQFVHEGRTYEIALRYARRYLPFSLHLISFTHERYPGTNIPRNFASKVHLVDHQSNEDRDALIYMNHPLRTGGFTFYQSSFGADSMGREDRASQLQVVRNPSWLLPYFACALITFGMLWQFCVGLLRFSRRAAPLPQGEGRPA